MSNTIPPLPMPRDTYDGGTVVASVWVDDEIGSALILTLEVAEPFYRVHDIEARRGEWRTAYYTEHLNIVPAVGEYEERGGDY